MKIKQFIGLILLITNTLSAQTVRIAAAANVREALEEMRTVYKQYYPAVQLSINYGSSGMFVQQISNGAHFDIFLSADERFPIALQKQGLTMGKIEPYALGKLVLYSLQLEVDQMGLDALDDVRVRKIAVANPSTAPYGTRAIELLQSLQKQTKLQSKLIYGESITQAAQYGFTGNAELSFISLSLVQLPGKHSKGYYYIIPSTLYKPIKQACVLIKQNQVNLDAVRFRDFILSPVGRSIWIKYGYDCPEKQ